MTHASRLIFSPRRLAGVLAGAVLLCAPLPAFALSELKPLPGQSVDQPSTGTGPGANAGQRPSGDGDPSGLPKPDPLVKSAPDDTHPAQAAGSGDAKPVEVIYDINKAPEAVRRMRAQIVEAAASGDIERLRPLLHPGPDQTQVTVGETSDDPIKTLKELSGDTDGIEILAILLDVVSAGFVHVGQGTPDEMYVWPYFAEKSLATLTPPEKVELLRIVTAGDFSDMQEFGGYNFYRVGIAPDGKWKLFVAGD